jgi:hypothetical protein
MDSSDGPEHVFHVDWTLVVHRNGTATEASLAPGPSKSKTVQLSPAEFRQVKAALAQLDLGALEQHFGTDKEGDGTTVLTYAGRTVTLDSRIMGVSPPDEGPVVARPFSRVARALTIALEIPQGDARHGHAPHVGAEPTR